MEVQKNGETGGSLQISTEVIAKIAKLAAMEVDGVQDVSAVAPSMRSILGQKASNTMKAVSVQMEDGVAQLTVNLLVAYGNRIPSMCAKVQENVKSTVQNMTGITVSRVNVVVRGVVVPQTAE